MTTTCFLDQNKQKQTKHTQKRNPLLPPNEELALGFFTLYPKPRLKEFKVSVKCLLLFGAIELAKDKPKFKLMKGRKKDRKIERLGRDVLSLCCLVFYEPGRGEERQTKVSKACVYVLKMSSNSCPLLMPATQSLTFITVQCSSKAVCASRAGASLLLRYSRYYRTFFLIPLLQFFLSLFFFPLAFLPFSFFKKKSCLFHL